jgi:hypothetical protein
VIIMPFFNRDNASLYYEDAGAGGPVVAMDMRGHGRTVTAGDLPPLRG